MGNASSPLSSYTSTASASWWPIRSTCSGPDVGTSWLSQSQNAPTQTNAARFDKGISTLDTVQELERVLKAIQRLASEPSGASRNGIPRSFCSPAGVRTRPSCSQPSRPRACSRAPKSLAVAVRCGLISNGVNLFGSKGGSGRTAGGAPATPSSISLSVGTPAPTDCRKFLREQSFLPVLSP